MVVLSPVWYPACTIKIGRWCELRSSTPYFIELVRGENCKHPHIWGEKLGFPSLVLQIIPIIPWFKIQNTYNKCQNLVFCQKWLGYIVLCCLPSHVARWGTTSFNSQIPSLAMWSFGVARIFRGKGQLAWLGLNFGLILFFDVDFVCFFLAGRLAFVLNSRGEWARETWAMIRRDPWVSRMCQVGDTVDVKLWVKSTSSTQTFPQPSFTETVAAAEMGRVLGAVGFGEPRPLAQYSVVVPILKGGDAEKHIEYWA